MTQATAWCRRMRPRPASGIATMFRCRACMERPRQRRSDCSPVPATDIEDVVVKFLNEHLKRQSGMPAPAITGQSGIAELIDRIDVHKDRLAVRLRSRESLAMTNRLDDGELTDDRL